MIRVSPFCSAMSGAHSRFDRSVDLTSLKECVRSSDPFSFIFSKTHCFDRETTQWIQERFVNFVPSVSFKYFSPLECAVKLNDREALASLLSHPDSQQHFSP